MTEVTLKDPEALRDFAERVERLCDFLLAHSDKSDSNDLKVLHKLKDDAANFQMTKIQLTNATIEGLDQFMKGVPTP